jgi:hypothetical protein
VRHRHHHHAALQKLGIALDQDRVRIQLDQERRALLTRSDLPAKRRGKLGHRADHGMELPGRENLVPGKGADVGPAPQLLGARGERRFLAMGPGRRAATREKFGLLDALGPRGDLALVHAA